MARTIARLKRRARGCITIGMARALFIIVLALPILFGPSLPFFARLAAGPRAHVCHCDAAHTECACPICFPDREDLKKNELAVSGPCGDDDPVFTTVALPAVLAPSVVVVARAERTLAMLPVPQRLSSHGLAPPEPPPPRA